MALKIPKDLQPGVEVRKRLHLSHAHVQMARELGMNPKKLGKLANHKQEPWKAPLPQYLEHLYEKRFGKRRPDSVVSLEERGRLLAEKKLARQEARSAAEEQRVGIAWYMPEQWTRLLEISADRESLEDTHVSWLAAAEQAEAQAAASGAKLERVIVDVAELETWCRSRSWVINAKSRSRFVAHLLSRREAESQKSGTSERGIASQSDASVLSPPVNHPED